MTDVSAQAFREAAKITANIQDARLLLAAAEQREQLDILHGSVAGQSDFIRQMGREHQQQLSAVLAIVDGFDLARPDDDEGGQLHNLRNILTGARETKHESTAPAIFLCQVCDQTPERGHAPDCPGSTGVDVYLGEVDTLKQQIATLTKMLRYVAFVAGGDESADPQLSVDQLQAQNATLTAERDEANRKYSECERIRRMAAALRAKDETDLRQQIASLTAENATLKAQLANVPDLVKQFKWKGPSDE